MRATKSLILMGLALLLGWQSPMSGQPHPLGTAFTYQGVLNDGGAPASGQYDFWFILYDDPDLGSVIGDISFLDQTVIDGRVALELDFGAGVFQGDARWLQVRVRATGNTIWNELFPRLSVTGTPYALYALDTAASGGIEGGGTTAAIAKFTDATTIGDSVIHESDGNIGIDTPTAASKLDVNGTVTADGVTVSGTVTANGLTVDGTVGGTGFNGWDTDESDDVTMATPLSGDVTGIVHATVVGDDTHNHGDSTVSDNISINNTRLYAPAGAGNVGVGTTDPGEKLSVAGVIESTSGGFKFPDGTTQGTAGPSGWSLTGNSGTTPGTHFLGTTDNEALELHVNSQRALRIEPTVTAPNLIGGYSGNSVTGGAHAATIGGGGKLGYPNLVTDWYGTVGGGKDNQAGSDDGEPFSAQFATVGGGVYNTAEGDSATVAGGAGNRAVGTGSTVGGGQGNGADASNTTVAGGWYNHATDVFATVGGGDLNTASGPWATIGGGYSNSASGTMATVAGGIENAASDFYATVGGGDSNRASARDATVGGGSVNTASGAYATVPGGRYNVAAGLMSFAAGSEARADHQGAFVWADSTPGVFASTGADQFLIQAAGGVGIGRPPTTNDLEVEGTASKTAAGDWLANSDARIKADVTRVENALETVSRLRPVKFKYTDEYRARHDSIEDVHYFNYVAQEYRQVFPDFVKDGGEDGLQIDPHPASVYAVAAVQELCEIVKEKDTTIADLEARVAALEKLLKRADIGQEGGAR